MTKKTRKTKMAAKGEQKQTGFRSIFANGSSLPYVSFTKNAALVDVFWGEKHSFW